MKILSKTCNDLIIKNRKLYLCTNKTFFYNRENNYLHKFFSLTNTTNWLKNKKNGIDFVTKRIILNNILSVSQKKIYLKFCKYLQYIFLLIIIKLLI